MSFKEQEKAVHWNTSFVSRTLLGADLEPPLMAQVEIVMRINKIKRYMDRVQVKIERYRRDLDRERNISGRQKNLLDQALSFLGLRKKKMVQS